MEYNVISIRPFIGSRNFEQSSNFYRDLGFKEISLGPKMSFFQNKRVGFYLQDFFVQDWVGNTMVFLEVENLDQVYHDLLALDLKAKYPDAKLIPICVEPWGREFFLHDPSGILWHFGEFK
jgi:catechol 2,3-dioxygenase-like lactoylglutathione lyase family enzyme